MRGFPEERLRVLNLAMAGFVMATVTVRFGSRSLAERGGFRSFVSRPDFLGLPGSKFWIGLVAFAAHESIVPATSCSGWTRS